MISLTEKCLYLFELDIVNVLRSWKDPNLCLILHGKTKRVTLWCRWSLVSMNSGPVLQIANSRGHLPQKAYQQDLLRDTSHKFPLLSAMIHLSTPYELLDQQCSFQLDHQLICLPVPAKTTTQNAHCYINLDGVLYNFWLEFGKVGLILRTLFSESNWI